MENNQPATPATPQPAAALPPLGEPVKATSIPTAVEGPAIPGQSGVSVTDAIKPTTPATQAAPIDTSGEGKFNIIIFLIVIALIVAGAAIFFLLTDQGRTILGLDKQPVSTTQQPTSQPSTQSQAATEVNNIVKEVEAELDKIDSDTSFAEFDEQAEFGVGI